MSNKGGNVVGGAVVPYGLHGGCMMCCMVVV